MSAIEQLLETLKSIRNRHAREDSGEGFTRGGGLAWAMAQDSDRVIAKVEPLATLEHDVVESAIESHLANKAYNEGYALKKEGVEISMARYEAGKRLIAAVDALLSARESSSASVEEVE